MTQPTSNWHLDKKVPIGIILAIFVQTCGMVWWAATMDQKVINLEKDINSMAGQDTRLTRLETRMESILGALERIEKKLN